MNTWTDIYKKYKDSELMKEFWITLPALSLNKANIKDIWGYFEVWTKRLSEEDMCKIVDEVFNDDA